MSTDELKEKVLMIARMQEQLRGIEDEIDKLKEKLNETSLARSIANMTEVKKSLEETIKKLTQEAKEAGLQAYQETGDKKPVRGIQIKVFQQLRYDEDTVKQWCIHHCPELVLLDVKAFEAKAGELWNPGCPWGQVEAPRAHIMSKELGQLLKEK